MLVMVVVGGRGSFWGVTIAAIVLASAPEALRWADEWRLIAYGVVLVVVVLTMPGGFAGLLKARRGRKHRIGAGETPALEGGER
jgi:ABC-type branched-subunit amino acid transport system permease subunit